MYLPPLSTLASAASAARAVQPGTAVASPPFVQQDTLRSYGSMPEFTRYALLRSSQHGLGYQLERAPVDASVRWDEVRPPRTPERTFSDNIETAARELVAQEPSAEGRQFLRDFLQACRERGTPLDKVAQDTASRNRTVADLQGGGIHSPSAERSRALVDTLLGSIRLQGQVLPLGHAEFRNLLAAHQPHMRRTLEKLAGCGVIPASLEWQLADYTERLGRVSQIVERHGLAGAEDFCRLFIEPEPNATVARQQRDWDRRLAELRPATSAEWQLRRRAAEVLAPLLNPQVAQHLLTALGAAGR